MKLSRNFHETFTELSQIGQGFEVSDWTGRSEHKEFVCGHSPNRVEARRVWLCGEREFGSEKQHFVLPDQCFLFVGNVDSEIVGFCKLSRHFHETFTKLSRNFHETFTECVLSQSV